MKSLLVTLVIAALAACSGGGGGTPGAPPTVAPTTPPLAYAAKIVWAGAMHYATTGASLYRPQSIDSSSGAILMVSGDSTDPTAQGGDPRGAAVAAQVSPAPTSYPTTTFTTTLAVASIAPTPTPAPSASPQPPTILLQPGHTNASGTGTVTATIASPVSVATTAPVIVYPMLTLNCGRAVPTGEHIFGVQWNGTAWVDDANPATADLYLGNNAGCFPGDSSTSNTLYYPGGGVILASTNAFDLIATTDWANAGTHIDIGLTANVMDKTLVFKTRSGVYAKYHPVAYGGYPDLGGAVEVHGQGLDSF